MFLNTVKGALVSNALPGRRFTRINRDSKRCLCQNKNGSGPLGLLYLLAQLLMGSPSNVACKEVRSLFASQDFDRKEH